MSTARLLSLLSILQGGGEHTGPSLARHLEVTERTVRRDVERLRELGYVIEARRGASGAYSLGSGGSAMPPLILDTEEMVALAVCVRAAAAESVAGVAEASGRALSKLRQTLPPAARHQADALAEATARLPSRPGEEVDHQILLTASAACHAGQRVRLGYRAADGRETERRAEPYRAVNVGRRWYLVAFDLDRNDWRTFRLDRVLGLEITGHGVEHLDDPPDPVALVQTAISAAPYRYQARVRIDADRDEVARRFPAARGRLEPADGGTTRLITGADEFAYLVAILVETELDFVVEEPDELRLAVAEAGARLLRAAGTT